MPRPRSLTESAIAEAALAIIDNDGTAQLSMRAVAEALGVGTMSLYRYVRDRDQLEGLVVDAVLGAAIIPPPSDKPWRERIVVLAERVRHTIRAHPAVVPLLLTRRHASLASVRWGEAMLEALAAAGFAGEARAVAFRTLLSFLIGSVQVDYYGPLGGPGTASLAALPENEFPQLSQTARAARRLSPERAFREGLSLLLDGITQRVGR
ncbi:MAG: TetR/AcrR family transcriptional regulator C-terminal domain-containing protein [Polyangiales bacterium]